MKFKFEDYGEGSKNKFSFIKKTKRIIPSLYELKWKICSVRLH